MSLHDFAFLTDENIQPEVVAVLREAGVSVKSVFDFGLAGHDDLEILELAFREKLVVISQDSDFGTLIFRFRQPFFGIIHIRPGHLKGEVAANSLRAVFRENPDLNPPFFLVTAHTVRSVRIRVKSF